MRRPLPVQVEPLSPQRWAKVERGLFARVESGALSEPAPSRAVDPPPRRKMVWLAAAAIVVSIGLAIGWPRPEAASEALTSRITTGHESSHLALPGLTLDIDPESTVVVGDASKAGMLIVVDRGSILCEVAPRPAQAPLIGQAGAAQVRVVGTRFKVQREGTAARVWVEHGVVEVSMGGRSTRVAGGQVWPAPSHASSGAAALAEAPAAETPAAAQAPAAADVTAVGGSAPVEALPAPSARRAPAPDAGSELSPRARFERAAALERTSPGVAISLYRGLELGSDSWAANALFAHGRLELSRGNHAQAERLLERYLVRFPRGANVDDAQALLRRMK